MGMCTIKRFKNKKDFNHAFDFTLGWEGGYVNDPNDPGGETKFGISKRANPSVDIKALTVDGAKKIYKAKYWDAAGCKEMDWPLNCVMFDMAVNLGVSRAKSLYREVGDNPEELITRRETYYQRLAKQKPGFQRYLRGWFNRTRSLRDYIKEA